MFLILYQLQDSAGFWVKALFIKSFVEIKRMSFVELIQQV